jgi:hypothetical protein
MKKYSSEKLNS